MDVAIHIINSNDPLTTTTLDFEFSIITNVSPLLPYLEKFLKLKKISFHGNRITELPENMGFLSLLEEIDLSNNMIQSVDNVLTGLKSIPNLRILNINLKGKEDEMKLMNELKKLEYLNGNKVVRQMFQSNLSFQEENESPKSSPENTKLSSIKNIESLKASPSKEENIIEENHDQSNIKRGDSTHGFQPISQEELEVLANLYDQIREIQKELDPDIDETLTQQFDAHVKNILTDLNSKMLSHSNEYNLKMYSVKSKYALFEICFSKFMEFLSKIDPRLAYILESLHDSHAVIFKDMSNIIQLVNTNKNSVSNRTEEKISSKINVSTNYTNEEVQQLLQTAEHFERQNLKLQEEKEELLSQMKSLEEDNQKYLEKIIRQSKSKPPSSPLQNINKMKSVDKITRKTNDREKDPEKENIPKNIMGKPFYAYIKSCQKLNEINTPLGHINVRDLTLKQLKDAVEEINDSKQKYDKKNLDAKLPRETMEQHIYTLLNHKYGLKNLTIEWAAAVLNGIKKYTKEDNEILVFAKILKNECDEEFRFVQNQVKNTIVELLKMYLRGKFPYKHNSEIKEMIETKVNSFISEEESQDIIKYMYNEEDAELILENLKILSEEISMNMNMSKKEKPKINYNAFQKVILDFQLHSHERFLAPFVDLFIKVDLDRNGIINEEEFSELMYMMSGNQDQENLMRFLTILDPFNHGNITFSQCVTIFSSETIPNNEGQNISWIQYLST